MSAAAAVRRARAGDRAAVQAEAAATVHRVAALVAGGLPLDRAWSVLGTDAAAVAARPGGGVVAAVLAVASETGAPMAPTLERLAGLLREQAAQRRALESALAGPRATAKLVMVLPIVGLGFGLALGLDVLGAATSGGKGTGSVAAGAQLLGAPRAGSRAVGPHGAAAAAWGFAWPSRPAARRRNNWTKDTPAGDRACPRR